MDNGYWMQDGIIPGVYLGHVPTTDTHQSQGTNPTQLTK